MQSLRRCHLVHQIRRDRRCIRESPNLHHSLNHSQAERRANRQSHRSAIGIRSATCDAPSGRTPQQVIVRLLVKSRLSGSCLSRCAWPTTATLQRKGSASIGNGISSRCTSGLETQQRFAFRAAHLGTRLVFRLHFPRRSGSRAYRRAGAQTEWSAQCRMVATVLPGGSIAPVLWYVYHVGRELASRLMTQC